LQPEYQFLNINNMKKILLMAAAVAMSISANAFDFKCHDKSLENGDRVNMLQYWEEDLGQFNPKLTVTSETGGEAKVTVEFLNSECGPALELDADGFGYAKGIGDPHIMFCWPNQCISVLVGQNAPQNGSLTAGIPANLQIELAYTIGYEDKGIENKDVNAEFTVEVKHAGETKKVTFYVDHESAGVEGIAADENAPIEYFDLQGRKVAAPENGIYIKRQGGRVQKVVL